MAIISFQNRSEKRLKVREKSGNQKLDMSGNSQSDLGQRNMLKQKSVPSLLNHVSDILCCIKTISHV